jgi:hypothetical protein
MHLRGCAQDLTEFHCECVFICQAGGIHDSRGRLLVRIGKVTVVRRPLQSMVCSGRLTICDQKYSTVDAERIRRTLEAPRAVHADWRVSLHQLVAQSNDWPLFLIDVCSAAGATKHGGTGTRLRRAEVSCWMWKRNSGFPDGPEIGSCLLDLRRSTVPYPGLPLGFLRDSRGCGAAVRGPRARNRLAVAAIPGMDGFTG